MKYVKRILLSFFIFLVIVTSFVFILVGFYKKEMASLLIDTLKSEYALTLKVEDADVSFFSNWPHASVNLKNVYLASDLYADKNEPLLKAKSISLSLNLVKLFKKQFIVNSISIKNAEVKLVKNVDGSRNFDFKPSSNKSKEPSSPSSINFEISNLSIKNTQFNFINRAKKQNIDIHFINNDIKLKLAQDGVTANLRGEILVGGLLFNINKGAYLHNTTAKTDLDFSVYYKSKMIVVRPSSFLTMDKHRYNVNALIQLGEVKKLMLRIESNGVDYTKAARLLNSKLQKVLDNFTVEKPFDIKALIIARIDIKEEPILILNFDVKDNNIKIGNSKIPYSHVSLIGTILSLDSSRQMGNAEEGKIKFKTIRGNLYDYPFTASVSITSLVTPTINAGARLLVEASKIKFKVAQDFILKGNCVANVNYFGPTNKLNTKEFLGPDMHLNASLLFNNFHYQEKDKPYTYVAKGKATVNNRDIKFENLLLKMDGGDVLLTGKVENFVNYVLGYGNSLKLMLSARSDYLNLNSYMQDRVATVKTGASDQNNSTNKTKTNYKQSMQDAGEGNFEFDVKLLAKKLYVRKVEILNASIDMVHRNELLTIKSVKADICDGKIFAKGSIYNLHKINAEMDMDNIDINMMFDEFDNFGQNKVQSKNLKGTVSMHAIFKTELDDKMGIVAESMAGEVKLRLKDGHLINFEPVQSMSHFIFKRRDFDNVTFSELNERFKIRGYEMDIQELEIGSNILNLFVTGIYNFKENSNINILIPWNNLRRRGKNYIPKTSGETAENARGLKLNFSGPTSDMKLSLGHKDIARK